MGLLDRSLLARDVVAALIILGILTMFIGELYALEVFFSGRTWLPRRVRQWLVFVFILSASVGLSALFSPWLSQFIESPGENSLTEVILLVGLGGACLIAFVFLSALMTRWAFVSSDQPIPASFGPERAGSPNISHRPPFRA